MTAEQEGSPDDRERRRLLLTELAFAPGGDPRVAADAAAALRELDAEQRREGEAASLPPAAPDDPPVGESDPPGRIAPARKRRRALLATGAALVVLVGLGVAIDGATSATRRAAVPEPTTSDPSLSSPSPSSPLPSVLSRALDRGEVPTDALPAAIRGEVDLGSSRVIYDEDPSLAATASRWRLWVGYGEDSDQVCFVATYDNVGDSVTCVPKQRALLDRVVLVSTLPGRRFEMLANGGAIAVQIG